MPHAGGETPHAAERVLPLAKVLAKDDDIRRMVLGVLGFLPPMEIVEDSILITLNNLRCRYGVEWGAAVYREKAGRRGKVHARALRYNLYQMQKQGRGSWAAM